MDDINNQIYVNIILDFVTSHPTCPKNLAVECPFEPVSSIRYKLACAYNKDSSCACTYSD